MADHAGLRDLASRQHGVVGRAQLARLGFSAPGVSRLVASGRLVRLSKRAFLVGGAPPSIDQQMVAAVLDVPGSVVARQTAAWLWGVPGFEAEPLHVLTTRRPHRDRTRLALMHSSLSFADHHRTTVRGVPVSTPARTLVDLAGRIHPRRLDQVCDRLLARRLLRLEQLHGVVEELSASLPRRGRVEVQRLVAARPDGYRPAESNLELRFEEIVARAGEPPFERQVELGDVDGWIGRVDFVDRHARVVVEVQGEVVHAGVVARVADVRRHERLRRAGWTVIEVPQVDLWHHPDRVVARVRGARLRAHRRPA